MHMTDNKKEDQSSNAVRAGKNIGEPLVGNIGGLSFTGGCDVTPGLGIEYHPHRSQGLQSASDMWIDKSKLTEGLVKDDAVSGMARKLSRQ